MPNAPIAGRSILLITVDQLRFDFVTGGAVPALATPNLDRIRTGGVQFPNAYSTCPVCMPARFSWMHALRSSQISMDLVANRRDWPAPGTLPTLPSLLQSAGYTTALVGKLHSEAGLYRHDLRKIRDQTRARGFDHVVEVSGKALAWWFDCDWTEHLQNRNQLAGYRDMYRSIPDIFAYRTPAPTFLEPADTMDGFIAARALDWLGKQTMQDRFFLHVSFCGPHFPLDPAAVYLDRFKDCPMPGPEGVSDPGEIRRWQDIRRRYCALIAQIDDEVGKLLDLLEDKGLAESTLVVFCTDHGDMMGHRGRGHKSQPYETSCRTPIYARCPGAIPPGRMVEGFVESIDLPVTLADWAGVLSKKSFPGSPGRSFRACLEGAPETGRGYCVSEGKDWRMCRHGSYKYVWRADGRDELYDLSRDPWELNNLISEPDQLARVADLRGKLLTEMAGAAVADPGWIPALVDNWLERELPGDHPCKSNS